MTETTNPWQDEDERMLAHLVEHALQRGLLFERNRPVAARSGHRQRRREGGYLKINRSSHQESETSI